MCFMIYSQNYLSSSNFQEFHFILPYPSPMKIDGIYDKILNFWNPNLDIELMEIPTSLLKLKHYFENQFNNGENDNNDNNYNNDGYDMYIATFQFHHENNIHDPNGNTSSLEIQSNNILSDVLNKLYCKHLNYSEEIADNFGFKGKIGNKWKNYIKTSSTTDINNPCGYQSLEFNFHDVNYFNFIIITFILF